MSQFASRWLTWNGGGSSTDITDKSTSLGNETSNSPTDKTDKSRLRNSVSREDELSVPVSTSDLKAENIAAMSLAEFARARLIVRLHSGVLGCDVLFVSDNVEEAELPETGLAIYRASELFKIAILHPEPHTLRYLHEVKTILNGSITDVQPSGEC